MLSGRSGNAALAGVVRLWSILCRCIFLGGHLAFLFFLVFATGRVHETAQIAACGQLFRQLTLIAGNDGRRDEPVYARLMQRLLYFARIGAPQL